MLKMRAQGGKLSIEICSVLPQSPSQTSVAESSFAIQAEQDNLFIIKHCKSVLNIFLESLRLVKAHIFLCVWQEKTFLIALRALNLEGARYFQQCVLSPPF